jgi:hypothetical protein
VTVEGAVEVFMEKVVDVMVVVPVLSTTNLGLLSIPDLLKNVKLVPVPNWLFVKNKGILN